MGIMQSYKFGGSLDGDNAFYVARAADQDLYEHLKLSDTCFVFNCRQMGKSSLRVRAMARLKAEGVVCVVIDPQSRGTTATEEQWYAGTIKRLLEDLELAEAVPFSAWWKDPDVQALSPVNRFEEFIDKVLLVRIAAPIVIFVEEIDNMLSLKFDTDGFFCMIRSLHERRTDHPAYQRLCFCFLGVATPYDLIRSAEGSAFNIGHAVELSGLGRQEAAPLLEGLAGKVADPQGCLDAVLQWSGGQPFLTQKLLAMVCAAAEPRRPVAELVEVIVKEQIIRNWEAQDLPVHLRTIRARLLQGREEHRGRLLGLVQEIQEKGGILANSCPEQMQLRLTGLVVPRQGQLQIYNPIYAAVFTPDWVNTQLEALRPAIYGEAINAWLKANPEDRPSHLIAGAPLASALAWAKGKNLSPADEEFLEASRAAEDATIRAAAATQLAEEQARVAEERARVAERDQRLAEQQARNRRRMVRGLSLVTVVGVGAAVVMWLQQQVANRQVGRTWAAVAEGLTKDNLIDPEKSIKLGIAALHRLNQDGTAESIRISVNLERAIDLYGETSATDGSANEQPVRIWSMANTLKDDNVIAAGPNGTFRIWPMNLGSPTRTINARLDAPIFLRLENGSILALGSSLSHQESVLQHWSPDLSAKLAEKEIYPGFIVNAMQNPVDGRIVIFYQDRVQEWSKNVVLLKDKPIRGFIKRAILLRPEGNVLLARQTTPRSDRLWLELWTPDFGHKLESTDQFSDKSLTSDKVETLFQLHNGMVVIGDYGGLQLWSESLMPIGPRLIAQNRQILSMAQMANKELLTASADGTLRRWLVDDKGLYPLDLPFPADQGPIQALMTINNDHMIISAGADGSLKQWKWDTQWAPSTTGNTDYGFGLNRPEIAVASPHNSGMIFRVYSDQSSRQRRLEYGSARLDPKRLKISRLLSSFDIPMVTALLVAKATPHNNRPLSSPDLVTGHVDGSVRLWRHNGIDWVELGAPAQLGHRPIWALEELKTGGIVAAYNYLSNARGNEKQRLSKGNLGLLKVTGRGLIVAEKNCKPHQSQSQNATLLDNDITAMSVLANGDLVSGYDSGLIVRWKQLSNQWCKTPPEVMPATKERAAVIYSISQINDDWILASTGLGSLNMWPLPRPPLWPFWDSGEKKNKNEALTVRVKDMGEIGNIVYLPVSKEVIVVDLSGNYKLITSRKALIKKACGKLKLGGRHSILSMEATEVAARGFEAEVRNACSDAIGT